MRTETAPFFLSETLGEGVDPVGVCDPLVGVADPETGALPLAGAVLFVVEFLPIAVAWNWANDFSGVGLTAKTIPSSQ